MAPATLLLLLLMGAGEARPARSEGPACPPGFAWDRMSGVGCVQEDCPTIANARFSYTGSCICNDGYKGCYEPVDYTGFDKARCGPFCPGSRLVACVPTGSPCPGQEPTATAGPAAPEPTEAAAIAETVTPAADEGGDGTQDGDSVLNRLRALLPGDLLQRLQRWLSGGATAGPSPARAAAGGAAAGAALGGWMLLDALTRVLSGDWSSLPGYEPGADLVGGEGEQGVKPPQAPATLPERPAQPDRGRPPDAPGLHTFDDATPEQEAEIRAATERGLEQVNAALDRLREARTRPDPEVRDAFGIAGTSAEDVARIDALIAKFEQVRGQILKGVPFEVDEVGRFCTDPRQWWKNGTVWVPCEGYVHPKVPLIGRVGDVHIVYPRWARDRSKQGVTREQDFDYRARVIVHELTHYNGDTADHAYAWDRGFRGLTADQRRNNADSLAWFAQRAGFFARQRR